MIHKIREKMPPVWKIRREGRFLGYSGYDEVFYFKKKNYVLLDFIRQDGRVDYHIHRYYERIGNLVNGYRESQDGSPI